jgi:type I restriction enzyme, R subunit
VEDGTTVKLNYALAPSDLRVDRETLEKKFLGLAEAEGVSDIEELNAILDRAVELKEMMKAETRVEKIAGYVAQHFRENVEPLGFKAFFVAVDREACALYKKALEKHLPPEYSRVVYSPAHNDEALLKEFYVTEPAEKDVRRAFIRKDAQPKILIVTKKLLTGFDALRVPATSSALNLRISSRVCTPISWITVSTTWLALSIRLTRGSRICPLA